MGTGEMNHQQAEDLRVRFGRMTREQYETESREVISRFFEGDVSQQSHAEMVVATYNAAFNDIFWQNYGGSLLELMIDPAKAKKVVSLLGFWFDSSLSQLGRYPYVVQLFFMNLPVLFDVARKERGYRDAGPAIDNLASKTDWYPLVRSIILQERKGILGRFGL